MSLFLILWVSLNLVRDKFVLLSILFVKFTHTNVRLSDVREYFSFRKHIFLFASHWYLFDLSAWVFVCLCVCVSHFPSTENFYFTQDEYTPYDLNFYIKPKQKIHSVQQNTSPRWVLPFIGWTIFFFLKNVSLDRF